MPPFVDDAVRYPNGTRLLRILRDGNFWYPREAPVRASSGAFYDTTRENSCFVLEELVAEHFEKIARTYPDSKLAIISAGQARESGYSVCDDPSDFLPGHIVVCPPREARINEYKRMASKLASVSVMYEFPTVHSTEAHDG
jgi:hypothetical protein